MSETKHTPTPWKYLANVGPTKIVLLEQNGDTIFECIKNTRDSRMEANAAYIVKACNSHEKLVRDREALLKALKGALEALYNETHGQSDTHWIKTTKEQARSAIAAAESEAKNHEARR